MIVTKIKTDKPLAMCLSDIEFMTVLDALGQYIERRDNAPSADDCEPRTFDSREDPDLAWAEGCLAADEEAKQQLYTAAKDLRTRMVAALAKIMEQT